MWQQKKRPGGRWKAESGRFIALGAYIHQKIAYDIIHNRWVAKKYVREDRPIGGSSRL